MIKILNSEDKNKTKLVSKETYKESLINSFADGIIGHFNDADFFFTDIDNGYLSYVAKSIDSDGFRALVKELKEEGYVQDLEALDLEDQIQYIYQNRLVDNYDLYELIDTSKLADLMMENKCGWIFSIDDTDNSFYTDLADLDLTEVTPNKKKYGIGDSVEFKDGRTGIVEDYDEKHLYVRDNNSNIVKIKKIKDGTWELPFTKEKAEKLYDLVCTDKYDGHDKMEILYGLYGDDNLFDALYNSSKETTVFNGNVIKRYIKKILKLYEENPRNFRVGLEPEAKVILKKIINE